MCGINGLWHASGATHETLEQCVKRMSDRLDHRGPDDSGIFTDPSAGLALGHRRLSIIDLSPRGHQPMASRSGRYVIVFNGEIYNHNRLRPELEARGVRFHGHSDTEVLLEAIECWGLDKALQRSIGMFAFALWDCGERRLTLARDRVGIKPLYYGWTASCFAFGSELKVFREVPGFDGAVDRNALSMLLTRGYVPTPYSIHEHVYKLPPGCWLKLDHGLASRPASPVELERNIHRYWPEPPSAAPGNGYPNISDEEATRELDQILHESIALRMEADVPVGAFLSGGIDSSAIVAIMQRQASYPVKTFSIGFREDTYDEAHHARAVASHLGTDHHELYVTARDALEVVPHLPAMFDEPFADAAQIPTFLISRLARQSVKVGLSGDGGDELFAGYDRYFETGRLYRRLHRIPTPMRNAAARALRRGGLLARSGNYASRLLPGHMRPRNPGAAAENLARLLACATPNEIYNHLITQWSDASRLIAQNRGLQEISNLSARRMHHECAIEEMMDIDFFHYLPDDCLTKVDRASMANGLEVRVPLLDHRVVEFAWQLPIGHKVRFGRGKWILRQMLQRYVPEHLVERPKMGFKVPIAEWLKGPLRGWAEALLDEHRLRQEGYFDAGAIRETWNHHVAGRGSEPYKLWTVLMFQAWLEQSRNGFGT